jgi:hypothetical protein
MRKLLMIGAGALAVAMAAFVDAKPSQAYYAGAWCAKMDVGSGTVTERCDFPTFETCRRYIIGESRSWCVQSQYYAPYWGVAIEPEYQYRRRGR